MFFVKLAFWLTLVIAFIPVPPGELPKGERAVSAGETISLGRAIVADLAGFCERNKTACNTGTKLASQMGAKAKEGARIVYTSLDDNQ